MQDTAPKPKRHLRQTLLAVLAALIILPLLAWVWNPALVLVAGFEFANMLHRQAGVPGNCSGQWSLSINASRPWLFPFYPETNATYHLMVLDALAEADPVNFTLSGTLPKARYTSLHVYDADTAEILLARTGEELTGGAGSNWQITIRQSRGQSGDETTGTDFAAIRPGARRLAFVWRSYLPEGAEPLPGVWAVNSRTGAPIAGCRNRFTLPQTVTDAAATHQRNAVLAQILDQQADLANSGAADPIRFFIRHAASTPFFANKHITYAFAPLKGSALPAIIRFRPAQGLRYWSACIGGIRETSTSACVGDVEIRADGEGRVTFLVGPDKPDLRELANRNGWNFLRSDWFIGNRIFILRELVTGEVPPGAPLFANQPDFDNAKLLTEQFADTALGEHAPVGRYCQRDGC